MPPAVPMTRPQLLAWLSGSDGFPWPAAGTRPYYGRTIADLGRSRFEIIPKYVRRHALSPNSLSAIFFVYLERPCLSCAVRLCRSCTTYQCQAEIARADERRHCLKSAGRPQIANHLQTRTKNLDMTAPPS